MVDSCSPEALKKARKKIEESAFLEYSDKLDQLREHATILNEKLSIHGMRMNKDFLTFTDKTGAKFDLSKLRSSTHMKRYSDISEIERMYISDYANSVQNIYNNHLAKRVSKEAFDRVMSEIVIACSERETFRRVYGDLAAKVRGKHASKVSRNFYYYFTDRPEDVFSKSTGQTWSPNNCERYGGSSEAGIYSDISHGAVIVFLRIIGTKTNFARATLRVCVHGNSKGDVSFGMDKYWYRGEESHARFTVNQNKRFDAIDPLTAKEATREVLEILKGSGIDMAYKTCTTPYVHEGFSDVEQKKKTAITYSWKYVDCPKCGEIVPVDQHGNPRCNNCSGVFTCGDCGGRFTRDRMHNDTQCRSCYRIQQEEENHDDDDDDGEQ